MKVEDENKNNINFGYQWGLKYQKNSTILKPSIYMNFEPQLESVGAKITVDKEVLGKIGLNMGLGIDFSTVDKDFFSVYEDKDGKIKDVSLFLQYGIGYKF